MNYWLRILFDPEPTDGGSAVATPTEPASVPTGNSGAPQPDPPEKEAADLAAFQQALTRQGGQPIPTEQPAEPVQQATPPGAAPPAEPEADPAAPAAESAQPDFDQIATTPQVSALMEKLDLKSDEIFDVAVNAFERVKIFDDDELADKWAKNSTSFIQHGLKLAKAQRDQDQYGSEYRNQRGDFEKWKSRKDATGGTDAPAVVAAPSEAISAAIEGLKESEMTSDIAEPLANMFAVVRSEHQNQVNALEKSIKTLAYQNVDLQLGQARIGLQEQYPDLKNQKTFDRVLEKYDAVAQSGKFPTVAASFAEAARWELGETNTSDLKNKLLSRISQRNAGQPRAAGLVNDPRKPTQDETDRKTFWNLREKHYGAHARSGM